MADFVGPPGVPGGALTEDDWKAITKEYPRAGFKEHVIETMCGFCRTKPETTYNNFQGDFGEERAYYLVHSLEKRYVLTLVRWF